MIDYTWVSMAAILRDWTDELTYKNKEHQQLVDIADSLYNVGINPKEFKADYKDLYDEYGKEYFDKVLDDMRAMDGQLTDFDKAHELAADYYDRVGNADYSEDWYGESYKRESKKLKEYVNNDVQKAWDLLDAWFEREWGEIPYNESAKAILVTEFPMTIVRDGSHTYEEGTGAVVLDLINCTAYYAVYDEDGYMYADNTDIYSNIQDMIDKLIQPMHDGKITEEDLIEKCERLIY